MHNNQHYERVKFVEQRQVKMRLFLRSHECADLIRLFSRLKEEQLEYPTDLSAARRDTFLQDAATIRYSKQFSHN